MHINFTVKRGANLSSDKNIDKNQLKELRKELILKTIDIESKIKSSRDYICKKSLKRIEGKLFETIREIEDLKRYLEG